MSGKLQITLKDEGITLYSPEMAKGEVALSPDEVDRVIAVLGEYRRRQGNGAAFEPGQKVENVIADPRWHIQPDALGTGVLLHIEDHMFGWLHYLIPKATAKEAARFLNGAADHDPMAGQSKS